MSPSEHHLKIVVVSQEKKLLEQTIDSLTATTSSGEVTILPHHIPMFTKLVPGELILRSGTTTELLVVSQGFLDIGPDNTVTVMVDAAVAARDISEEKAQAAIEQARETMINSQDRQELLMAEASLKLAMLELKVAQKSKKNTI